MDKTGEEKEVQQEQSRQMALRVFRKAASRVPAYKRLLETCGWAAAPDAATFQDFASLPVIDKKSYLMAHDMLDLVPDRIFPPMAYASSGSSGVPTFWFRGEEQDATGGAIHEYIFREVFGLQKHERTLVVVCFAMGTWVAGTFTLDSCRRIAERGYHLVTVTPSIVETEVLHVLQSLAPSFERLILAGYPPFIHSVVLEAKQKKILPDKDIRVIVAGQNFAEKWRAGLVDLLEAKDSLSTVVGIYGAADAGVLGHETPLTIFVRKTATQNAHLRAMLFGTTAEDTPALVQYQPSQIHFEEISGELVFTADTGIPLVRYCIHDIGCLVSYESMIQIMREAGIIERAAELDLLRYDQPFLVVKGRSDVAVTFYSVNIYPEHVALALTQPSVGSAVTGSFAVYCHESQEASGERLIAEVELAEGIHSDFGLGERVQRELVRIFCQNNSEYKHLHSKIGEDRASPTVRLLSHGQTFTRGFRRIVALPGKKAQVQNS